MADGQPRGRIRPKKRSLYAKNATIARTPSSGGGGLLKFLKQGKQDQHQHGTALRTLSPNGNQNRTRLIALLHAVCGWCAVLLPRRRWLGGSTYLLSTN